ncbi:MAG: outer membrane protein assembly factor BamD [Ignavibacteriales bacterium]|jgi:outer membrane protein assembly factor BamD|nr:outer membrane protein assembly factor BamD [Ignavibacteriales bacterium]
MNCSSSVDTSKFTVDEYFTYLMKLYNEEEYETAVQEFQNFLLQYSGSAYNDDAQYYFAMTYFKRGQYLLAAYEFSKLIRNIPASPFVPEAQFMLAESYYQLAPPYQLDQAYTKKAIEEFQVFIDFFPADKKVAEAEAKIKELTERLAEKEYQSGLIYEKMEYEKAAIKYYAFVADTYHDTKFAPISLYRKIQLEIKKGMNAEAIADINTYLNRYPNDERVNDVKQLEAKLIGKN